MKHGLDHVNQHSFTCNLILHILIATKSSGEKNHHKLLSMQVTELSCLSIEKLILYKNFLGKKLWNTNSCSDNKISLQYLSINIWKVENEDFLSYLP